MINVRFLRTYNRLSCRQLSIITGVSCGVIYKLEVNRKKKLPLESLLKLCEAFQISLADLLFKDMRKTYDKDKESLDG